MTPAETARVAEIAGAMMKAESEQITRDMASHVGDQVHGVLKRSGMAMRTTGGAVAMGALAAAQVLSEAIEFGRLSMDGDREDEADVMAGACLIFAEHLSPAVRHILATAQERGE